MKHSLVIQTLLVTLFLMLVRTGHAAEVKAPAVPATESAAWTPSQLEALKAVFEELDTHAAIRIDPEKPVPEEYDALLNLVRYIVAEREGFVPSDAREHWRIQELSRKRITGVYADGKKLCWFDYRF